MKPNTLFFVEFLFFDVVALGWAAWELWSVRRPETDRRAETPDLADSSPEPPRHPEG